MDTQFNQFVIQRFPKSSSNLRAWDAADEYLCNELLKNHDLTNKELLIFNDSFGALTVSLSQYSPTSVTDSFISQQSILKNMELNNLNHSGTNLKNSLQSIDIKYDFVVIKIPKLMDYLIYFLSQIQNNIQQNCIILIAGMMKHIPKNLWNTLQNFGECTTLPGVKKAKLLYLNITNKNIKSPYPNHFKLPGTDTKIFNHANVFSKASLDIGTRFLLDHLPNSGSPENIIDLGCGNGVIGLMLSIKYPQAHITFTDESYMAADSARMTMKHNFNDLSRFDFVTTDCLEGFESNSYDLIVNNPPFHQNSTLGTFIAEKMFKQSHKTLKVNGVLIVVANRHLPYYQKLKRLFKRTETIAGNKKFNVYLCTK